MRSIFVWFLGTGASEGIPAFNCMCNVCNEARKFAFLKRRQSSILMLGNNGNQNILIDAGWDITQILSDIRIRGVILTHWHHDHFAGLYVLRWNQKGKILPSFIQMEFPQVYQ